MQGNLEDTAQTVDFHRQLCGEIWIQFWEKIKHGFADHMGRFLKMCHNEGAQLQTLWSNVISNLTSYNFTVFPL